MLGSADRENPRLTNHEIILDFQPMWSRYLKVTDRQDGQTDVKRGYYCGSHDLRWRLWPTGVAACDCNCAVTGTKHAKENAKPQKGQKLHIKTSSNLAM